MNDAIRMSKNLVECFTGMVKYEGTYLEILYVPRFGKKPGWVGPGYWEVIPGKEPPSAKFNTRVYSREELLKAGAKSKMEYLWMR
jgi:hypothetical protein